MKKKILSILLISSLSLSLSASVFAEDASTPITSSSIKSVPFSSPIPSTYLKEYQGQFHTFDQVYEAFHQEVRPMTNEENLRGEYAYVIQSPDELAALLAYNKDQIELAEQQASQLTINDFSTSPLAASSIITRTDEATIYSNYAYWIKGYITIDYVPTTGKITQTTARTALLGVTYGHTWKPAIPRITVLSNIKRSVLFAGVITTNVFVGGIGEVLSDNVSYTFGIQSINTIE